MIRHNVWTGSLPICVQLSDKETRADGSHSPKVYYLKAQRVSYLPIYMHDILKYFRPYLNNPADGDSLNSWWFEFEQVPLRWNWPIGLLYDLLTGYDPTIGNTCLPWVITLNRREYPSEYILEISDDSLWDNWLNMSKQSACIRDGNPKSIMSLTRQETDQLWGCILDHNFDRYWSIMDRLLPPLQGYKNIPLKIYFPMSNQVRQAQINPVGGEEEEQRVTVGQALNGHLPELFPSRRRCILARPLIHGVSIPLEAPLVEMIPQCMYLDGFLHVSIVMMS